MYDCVYLKPSQSVHENPAIAAKGVESMGKHIFTLDLCVCFLSFLFKHKIQFILKLEASLLIIIDISIKQH